MTSEAVPIYFVIVVVPLVNIAKGNGGELGQVSDWQPSTNESDG